MRCAWLACAPGVLRFGGACTKDDPVLALPAAMPVAFRVSARGCQPMSGYSTARQKMVDGQVRPSDVTDIRIIDAMLAVPREAFVPENKRALAYLDLDLDVGEGGAEKRFLIKPAVLAKMLQAAEIKETDNVLVVGCACGYAAAVIARFCPARSMVRRRSRRGMPQRRPYRRHRPERRDRNRAGKALCTAPGWRAAGRGICDVAAAAGYHRDPFPRRFREPGAVRRRRARAGRHGTAPGVRFLAALSSEVEPGP